MVIGHAHENIALVVGYGMYIVIRLRTENKRDINLLSELSDSHSRNTDIYQEKHTLLKTFTAVLL